MASSSSPSSSSPSSSSRFVPGLIINAGKCFYCMNESSHFRRGWQLRSGNYAGLCDKCASAYESGSFCKIYHWSTHGWRNCVVCEKLIHCGCIMSEHTHLILDAGGVKCMNCVAKEFMQGNTNPQDSPLSSDGAASKSMDNN